MLKDKPTDDSRPTIEEAYSAAGNAGNLSGSTSRPSQADVLMASGMSHSAAGGALMRLKGEWDGAARPKVITPSSLRAQALSLRTMGQALTQTQMLAICNGLDARYAPEVLYWWLAPNCPHCDGHGTGKLPGLPVRSLRKCGHCNGSKTKPVPYGKAGQRLLGAMEEAINDWRSLTGRKLRSGG